jgi:hypothetical protein
MPIRACELPDTALLRRYRDAGAYSDCYHVDVDLAVTQARYVEAFYCTVVFRLERAVLALAGRPSSDAQVRGLANGTARGFAAWTVEARTDNQLLLCDDLGRTRSWLMSEAQGAGTRLYFGSAVVPRRDATGGSRLGFPFKALLGFHKLYSRVLLHSARQRLRRHGWRGG